MFEERARVFVFHQGMFVLLLLMIVQAVQGAREAPGRIPCDRCPSLPRRQCPPATSVAAELSQQVSRVLQTLCYRACDWWHPWRPSGVCACVVEGFVDNQLQFSLPGPDTADFLLNKNCVRILPPFMIMSEGMKVSLGLHVGV
jgi:hypothetical protein